MLSLAAAAGLAGCGGSDAQSGGAPVAFKLGTFERNGRRLRRPGAPRHAGRSTSPPANTAFEAANASAPKLTAPADMKALIARYDAEWKARLAAIATDVSAPRRAPAVRRPRSPACKSHAAGAAVAHPQRRRQLRRAHRGHRRQQQQRAGARGAGSAGVARPQTAPGIWERPAGDTRDNPYLFQKSPTVVIGPIDPIVMPRGRTNIDFECEFSVVIGKPAKYVPVANAADYIFGYTVQIDVSDRGGRGDRKMGGSDWLVGKNHDTFGPLGPFIVPKEFVKDPMNIRHTFTLNDDGDAGLEHQPDEPQHLRAAVTTRRTS